MGYHRFSDSRCGRGSSGIEAFCKLTPRDDYKSGFFVDGRGELLRQGSACGKKVLSPRKDIVLTLDRMSANVEKIMDGTSIKELRFDRHTYRKSGPWPAVPHTLMSKVF